MIVTLKPGESITIEFFDCDGQFECHFDTSEHPNRILLKETAALQGSEKGESLEVLYEELFGMPTELSKRAITELEAFVLQGLKNIIEDQKYEHWEEDITLDALRRMGYDENEGDNETLMIDIGAIIDKVQIELK